MSDLLFAIKYITCLLYTRFVIRDKENLENTKWVVRSRKSQDRQYNGQNKKGQRDTIIYKPLQRKLNI